MPLRCLVVMYRRCRIVADPDEAAHRNFDLNWSLRAHVHRATHGFELVASAAIVHKLNLQTHSVDDTRVHPASRFRTALQLFERSCWNRNAIGADLQAYSLRNR